MLWVSAHVAEGCGGETTTGTPGACTSDLASIQETIFAPSCATTGCHGSKDPAGGLDLSVSASALETRLVGVQAGTCSATLVVPGAPSMSFLYQKLVDTVPACGDHMPIGGDLSADQKSCIEQWIQSLPPADAGGDGGCETCGGAVCVDFTSDPAHCGDCATACPAGASCDASSCACAGGLTLCGSGCVDVTADTANCGGCNMPCPGGALCANSQCACAGGLSVCGDACVDKTSDPMNCGTCGTVCGANQVCNNGMCSNGCGALTQCGASCVDTTMSATNCSGCGVVCPGGASCANSMCVCPQGTSACNGQCINTATDPANCGGCGVMCAQGTTCQGSMCMCPGGGTVCGGSCVDTVNDPANCGGCGVACAVGQTCSSSACTCGAASVSFAAAVQPIFTASCALNGCHKGVMPQAGLDLSTAAKSYPDLVNVAASQCLDGRKRVLPGQPQNSYIIQKMMNVNLCFGTQMPKLGQVPQGQIQTIADWICSGAPNN